MGISLALCPHPVRLAEELAMVDNLSHGRLIFGIISSGAQNIPRFEAWAEGSSRCEVATSWPGTLIR